jgi:hypothetical protein
MLYVTLAYSLVSVTLGAYLIFVLSHKDKK